MAPHLTMENNRKPEEEKKHINDGAGTNSIVIPVIQEKLTVEKEVVETAKVHVRTTVTEEEATVNLPIVSEQYEVRRFPVDKVFPTAPSVRYEGDVLIVPVVEEIVVVEKRYKVVEEVHLIKQTTETPFTQQITLQKENVQVERIHSNGDKIRL